MPVPSLTTRRADMELVLDVIDTMLKRRGAHSLQAIADMMGTERHKLLLAMEVLVRQRFVLEVEQPVMRGRPATWYRLNPDKVPMPSAFASDDYRGGRADGGPGWDN